MASSKPRHDTPSPGGDAFDSKESIGLALVSIDPNLPRDDWVRVGMALKSELGESGFEYFDDWSKNGQSYDPRATRDAWKSFKEGGPVKIATLYHLAQMAGWKPDRPPPPPPPIDPKKIEAEKRAELKKKREEASAAGNGRAVYQLGACRTWLE